MNRREWHEETVRRLERAAARLEERAETTLSKQETVRLGGKVEGVKLALAYLREGPLTAIEEEEADAAARLKEARDHVAASHYFGDELDHADFAKILGGVELVSQ